MLPAAAVPGRVVAVEALPRLVNGKIDRAALRLPAEGAGGGVPPEGRLEMQVAAVFAEVLGLGPPVGDTGQPVGATDDFFALGGDSLQALQTLWRLNEALGRELPVDLIYRARTVRAVAAWVAEAAEVVVTAVVATEVVATEVVATEPAPEVAAAGRAPADPPLFEALALAPGTGRPVWWLPPAYGLSLPYRGLLAISAPGRPAWALERLLGPEAATEHTVEALAAAAGAALRAQQPVGPWTLVGWSFGGVLAWALARQLCAAHGPAVVDRVVLIDSAAPGSGFDFTAGDAHNAALAARRLGHLVVRPLHLDPAELGGLGAEDLTQRVLDLAAAHGLPVTPAIRRQALSVVALRTAALAALHTWRPTPWHGPAAPEAAPPPIWILRAAESEADWTAGWDALSPGPRARRLVPRDHQSMLEPPHAEALAAALEEALGAPPVDGPR